MLASCGRADGPGSDGAAYGPAATPDPASNDGPDDISINARPRFDVEWGYASVYDSTNPPPENGAKPVLEEMFNVNLETRYVSNFYGNPSAELAALAARDTPDIFYSSLSQAEVLSTGGTRVIQAETLREYAPRYAALLDKENGWGYVLAPGDETSVRSLIGYYPDSINLNYFSVYRLDLLDELGIVPRGELVRLEDRVFFTEEAFTQDELVFFLNSVTRIDTSDPSRSFYGTAWLTRDESARCMWRTMFGMFGLNFSNVSEGGRAAPYYASEAYKSFLAFQYGLIQSGAVANFYEGAVIDVKTYAQVGWRQESIYGRPATDRLVLDADSNARLLYAPPEIGAEGFQGIPGEEGRSRFAETSRMYVSANVSDEKLARILEMFDAISFEPETYMLSLYGVGGRDYIWEGAPYVSRLLPFGDSFAYSWFGTTVQAAVDVNVMFGRDDPLTKFAKIDKGETMVNYPYKEDIRSEHIFRRAELDALHSDSLRQIEFKFIRDVMYGEKDLDASWDDYILELTQNGLSQYIDLFDKYPVRGKMN